MVESLLNFDGLEPKRLKRKRSKYQHGKSFLKFFKNGKSTDLERKVHSILRELKIPFTTQFQVETKFYDVYINMYNMLIEIDSNYWHGLKTEWHDKNKIQKKCYYNDIYKDGLAKKHGYKLVRIKEDDISKSKIKKLIEDAIK